MVQKNASPEEIENELYNRPEFKARFPGIAHRDKYGYPPISVDEYLSFENTFAQAAKAYGIEFSKERTDALISLNVSVAEAEERLSMAAKAVYQSDRLTREELNRLYGVTTPDLIRYWLNPREELPVLQRRFITAEIGGEAKRSGFGHDLGVTQLEYLADRGMSVDNAAEAFGSLVESEEIFEAVDTTEQDISVNDQLKLITGDADMAETVRKRGGKRVAKFQEGGSFSTGQSGIAGLGKASS
jgi:hypothetical protein